MLSLEKTIEQFVFEVADGPVTMGKCVTFACQNGHSEEDLYVQVHRILRQMVQKGVLVCNETNSREYQAVACQV